MDKILEQSGLNYNASIYIEFLNKNHYNKVLNTEINMQISETVRKQINYIIKDFRPKVDLLYIDTANQQFRIVKGKSSEKTSQVAHSTLELSALTFETIRNRQFMWTFWEIATPEAVYTFIRKIQTYVQCHLPLEYAEQVEEKTSTSAVRFAEYSNVIEIPRFDTEAFQQEMEGTTFNSIKTTTKIPPKKTIEKKHPK